MSIDTLLDKLLIRGVYGIPKSIDETGNNIITVIFKSSARIHITKNMLDKIMSSESNMFILEDKKYNKKDISNILNFEDHGVKGLMGPRGGWTEEQLEKYKWSWNPYSEYHKGDMVEYNWSLYECLEDTNSHPYKRKYWKNLSKNIKEYFLIDKSIPEEHTQEKKPEGII